jgi:ParB family chromosome partitioning protein
MDFSAVLNKVRKGKTLLLPINELKPNPLQPRRVFDRDELYSLASSIKEYGLIQPVAVKRSSADEAKNGAKYEIIAGERRWRACKLAGLTAIPCTVFETDRTGSAMMALVENLQRSDLSFFEEALAMQTLLNGTEMPQSELAHALSISQCTLSNKLRLLRLSERERLIAVGHELSERHCRALVRISSESDRASILQKIITEKLSAPESERLVDEFLNRTPQAALQKAKKKKPTVKGTIGDMRLLYNTLDKAVGMLKTSGYCASWDKQENGNGLIVTICVKK